MANSKSSEKTFEAVNQEPKLHIAASDHKTGSIYVTPPLSPLSDHFLEDVENDCKNQSLMWGKFDRTPILEEWFDEWNKLETQDDKTKTSTTRRCMSPSHSPVSTVSTSQSWDEFNPQQSGVDRVLFEDEREWDEIGSSKEITACKPFPYSGKQERGLKDIKPQFYSRNYVFDDPDDDALSLKDVQHSPSDKELQQLRRQSNDGVSTPSTKSISQDDISEWLRSPEGSRDLRSPISGISYRDFTSHTNNITTDDSAWLPSIVSPENIKPQTVSRSSSNEETHFLIRYSKGSSQSVKEFPLEAQEQNPIDEELNKFTVEDQVDAEDDQMLQDVDEDLEDLLAALGEEGRKVEALSLALSKFGVNVARLLKDQLSPPGTPLKTLMDGSHEGSPPSPPLVSGLHPSYIPLPVVCEEKTEHQNGNHKVEEKENDKEFKIQTPEVDRRLSFSSPASPKVGTSRDVGGISPTIANRSIKERRIDRREEEIGAAVQENTETREGNSERKKALSGGMDSEEGETLLSASVGEKDGGRRDEVGRKGSPSKAFGELLSAAAAAEKDGEDREDRREEGEGKMVNEEEEDEEGLLAMLMSIAAKRAERRGEGEKMLGEAEERSGEDESEEVEAVSPGSPPSRPSSHSGATTSAGSRQLRHHHVLLMLLEDLNSRLRDSVDRAEVTALTSQELTRQLTEATKEVVSAAIAARDLRSERDERRRTEKEQEEEEEKEEKNGESAKSRRRSRRRMRTRRDLGPEEAEEEEDHDEEECTAAVVTRVLCTTATNTEEEGEGVFFGVVPPKPATSSACTSTDPELPPACSSVATSTNPSCPPTLVTAACNTELRATSAVATNTEQEFDPDTKPGSSSRARGNGHGWIRAFVMSSLLGFLLLFCLSGGGVGSLVAPWMVGLGAAWEPRWTTTMSSTASSSASSSSPKDTPVGDRPIGDRHTSRTSEDNVEKVKQNREEHRTSFASTRLDQEEAPAFLGTVQELVSVAEAHALDLERAAVRQRRYADALRAQSRGLLLQHHLASPPPSHPQNPQQGSPEGQPGKQEQAARQWSDKVLHPEEEPENASCPPGYPATCKASPSQVGADDVSLVVSRILEMQYGGHVDSHLDRSGPVPNAHDSSQGSPHAKDDCHHEQKASGTTEARKADPKVSSILSAEEKMEEMKSAASARQRHLQRVRDSMSLH